MRFLLLTVAFATACTGEFRPVLDDDTGKDSGAGTTDGGSGDAGDGGSGDGGGDGGSGDGGSGDGGGDGGSGDGGGDGGWPGGTADYCHLQWPCTMSGAPGATSEPVYVWVFEKGLTQGEGAGKGAIVEVGVGPDQGDPATGPGWAWTRLAWSADKDGLSAGDKANDEYAGTFSLPSARGEYDYCGRVSLDGGSTWLHCDLAEAEGNGCRGQGSEDGYNWAFAGALTVE